MTQSAFYQIQLQIDHPTQIITVGEKYKTMTNSLGSENLVLSKSLLFWVFFVLTMKSFKVLFIKQKAEW